MAPEKFCFKWKRHEVEDTSAAAQHHLYEADVTLLCEGKSVKAHKTVLTANSSFFREQFAADPDRGTVVIPKDVSFDDLTTLIESMYLGEVILGKHQLFALLKAADTLKVYGRCTFSLDKRVNEVYVDSSDRVRPFMTCEGPQLPQNSPERETSVNERDAFIDQPSTLTSGFVQCAATDNVQDSSLQLATANDFRVGPTPMSETGVEQTNACTNKAWLPASAVVDSNAANNLEYSKQQPFPVLALPITSTYKEISGTPSPFLDAVPSDSLDSVACGSKLHTGLYPVPEAANFVEGAEVGHPLTGVEFSDTVAVASDMPDAGGDTIKQASDAGSQQPAPGPDSAPLSSYDEGSSYGANPLRPSKTTTRKRAASGSNTQVTSVKARTEEASCIGPITRSRAARLAKQ